MKKKIFILTACIFAAGCKCKQTAPDVVHTRTETIVQRDTVFKIKPDASQYTGQLTLNGSEIILEKIHQTAGQSKALQAPRVQLQHNRLQVDCYLDEQKLYAQWKEKHLSDEKTIVKKVAVKQPLLFWQKGLMYSGGVFIALLLFWMGKLGYTRKL